MCEPGDTGSIDLVDAAGNFLVQVNISFLQTANTKAEGETLIVDVIDVSKRYESRRVIVFSQTERKFVDFPPGGTLASVDFRNGT